MTVLDRLRRGELAGARALDLAGLGLTSVPQEVFGLAETLEVLDLGRNPLAGLPDELGRLRRLRVLFCSGVPMRVLPPVLGDCVSLSQVGFRGCGIEEVPGDALPAGLRWLTLTDNLISALPEEIGRRPALQKLMLSGNRLDRLPDTLAGAEALELLRLAANRFAALPGWVGEMPRLAWLAMAGNQVEQAWDDDAGEVVETAALQIGAPLGEGASGRVHAGVWDRGVRLGTEEVAVKLFKGAMTSDGLPAREMAAALAVGDHPNLLGGLGRLWTPDGEALVMRRLPAGWQLLAGPPSLESCSRDVYAPDLVLPGEVAWRIALGVAAAGAHLWARGVMHGDLYAHNVHWDGVRGETVLGDFGAACRCPAGSGYERLDVLAWGILAGELIERAPACEASERLARLRDVATDRTVAARPRFAEILAEMETIG